MYHRIHTFSVITVTVVIIIVVIVSVQVALKFWDEKVLIDVLENMAFRDFWRSVIMFDVSKVRQLVVQQRRRSKKDLQMSFL